MQFLKQQSAQKILQQISYEVDSSRNVFSQYPVQIKLCAGRGGMYFTDWQEDGAMNKRALIGIICTGKDDNDKCKI